MMEVCFINKAGQWFAHGAGELTPRNMGKDHNQAHIKALGRCIILGCTMSSFNWFTNKCWVEKQDWRKYRLEPYAITCIQKGDYTSASSPISTWSQWTPRLGVQDVLVWIKFCERRCAVFEWMATEMTSWKRVQCVMIITNLHWLPNDVVVTFNL